MTAITIEKVVRVFIAGITFIIIGLLVSIFSIMFIKGFPAFHDDFLFAESKDFGRAGGVFYQSAGTLILMTTAVF